MRNNLIQKEKKIEKGEKKTIVLKSNRQTVNYGSKMRYISHTIHMEELTFPMKK